MTNFSRTLNAGALAGAVGLAFAVPAVAQGDPMEPYYTNTAICLIEGSFGTYECHTWYNKDGTVLDFSNELRPDGSFTVLGKEGTYRLTGNRMCVTWKGQAQVCQDNFRPLKLDEKTTITHTSGKYAGATETITLVAGRK